MPPPGTRIVRSWSFHSPNALTISIALEDATFQNGCLYFLPGTHRDGSYRNADITVNMDSIFEAYRRSQVTLG